MSGTKTILVTGGAGFIGGHFVRRALNRGYRVVNLDALTYAADTAFVDELGQDPQHVFVQGSICDERLLRRLLHEQQPHALVNFAAETHVDRSIDGPAAFLDTNARGVLVLLNATTEYFAKLGPREAAGFRFVQVSTDEVFGSVATGMSHKGSPYAPNSPYAASKAAGDHLARAWYRTYGLPAIITWCGNNYGPRQFPEKLIPLVIARALKGESIPLYGNGRNIRDWIHVSDHCRALENIVEGGKPGEGYAISASDLRLNVDVVRAICENLDMIAPRPDATRHASAIVFVEDRPGHDERYALDATGTILELGWQPKISFHEGLAETIAWYVANDRWRERIALGVYAGERLGRKPLVESGST